MRPIEKFLVYEGKNKARNWFGLLLLLAIGLLLVHIVALVTSFMVLAFVLHHFVFCYLYLLV